MREYRHPGVDHTFIIRDISLHEIEIDGVRLHKKDCYWMLSTIQAGGEQSVKLSDLTLPILQHVLAHLKEGER